MCGIAGHVSFVNNPNREAVGKLIEGIRHRGPDDSGISRSQDGLAVLGHARLSIIDLSDRGHQPMLDPITRNEITFNGEIYNYLELRVECERGGYQFQSDTDTEVILALYRLEGIDCLQRLRGMFAFAIWDASKRQLFIARDRAGKKPLNYSVNGREIVFCSELQPLSKFPGLRRDEDQEALQLYLQLQYIPAPWTIYKSIRKLPPASYAVFDRDGLRIERYWSINYQEKARLSENDAIEGLKEKIVEALRLRLRADVPVGALLSGGVDSSLIVALMAEIQDAPVRTFSIAFKEKQYDESEYSGLVAERYGTEHCNEVVDADIASLVPKLISYYGEPYGDQSAVPSFVVCEQARAQVKVVVNGDGGDELLGGYGRYQLSNMQQQLAKINLGNRLPRYLIDINSRIRSGRSVDKRAARWAMRHTLRAYCTPEMRMAMMYRGFWNDNERSQITHGKGNDNVLLNWQRNWINMAEEHATTCIDQMLWVDNQTYLPGDLLVKMDIASMHCGLEARSPLLDHEVIEYCATLPVDYKVRDGTGKYLIKKLCERYFDKKFVYRPKMGFSPPIVQWLRGSLYEQTNDILNDSSAMELFDQKEVLRVWEAFQGGMTIHAPRLWVLLMYGLWRQHTNAG